MNFDKVYKGIMYSDNLQNIRYTSQFIRFLLNILSSSFKFASPSNNINTFLFWSLTFS